MSEALESAAVSPPSAEKLRAPSLWIRSGKFFFRFRDALFPLVFIVLAATTPGRWPLDSRRLDNVLNGAGIAIALAGQLLRALVIGLAYIRRGGRNRRVHADASVQEGFFAHSRNPLYLGNLLSLFGLLLVHNSTFGYLVGLPFFTFSYLAIVHAEEDYLARRFGNAYRDYCRRVPRFLPRLIGLRATVRGMRFDWRRLLRKEYGTTFTGVTAILALPAWNDYQNLGGAAVQSSLRRSLALWIPCVVAYLIVRYLKKRGALGRG